MRNLWVFGGTGFIGRELLAQLHADADSRITVLVHNTKPFRHLEWANVISGSLGRFDHSWFERFPPDVIFHMARLAGSTSLRRKLASWRGARANQRIINYLETLDNKPVIVYGSGSLMYGTLPEGKLAFEDSPLNPTAFARQYIEAERPWMNARESGVLDVRFARPGWILGPGSWFKVFFWQYYRQYGKIPFYGDGQQWMSLVHVEDCAQLIQALSIQGMPNENLNIFCGMPVRHIEFVESVSAILGAPIEKIAEHRLRNNYGKAAAEALLSSIPLGSQQQHILESTILEHQTMAQMIERTCAALERM